MSNLRVGSIGCGGRARAHARGYAFADNAEIVACADPVEESAQAYAKDFAVANVYSDYREMLEKEELDVVSNCTWTKLHTPIVIEAAQSGVRAIHSEKPIAVSWADAKKQHQAAVDKGVQLTYCHQRRFHPTFYRAKQLIKEGAIGELQRVEGTCRNLFDWGTHWFNMFCYYNDDQPAEAVMAQIDAKGAHTWFDVTMEGGGLAWIKWQNGVQGLMVTGHAGDVGADNFNRILGADGLIEVGIGAELRVLSAGQAWRDVELTGSPYDDDVARICEKMRHDDGEEVGMATGRDMHYIADVLSVLDLLRCVESGEEPALSSRTALASTELLFAAYESARQRAQVVLPLEAEDWAFSSMLEDGTLVAS